MFSECRQYTVNLRSPFSRDGTQCTFIFGVQVKGQIVFNKSRRFHRDLQNLASVKPVNNQVTELNM